MILQYLKVEQSNSIAQNVFSSSSRFVLFELNSACIMAQQWSLNERINSEIDSPVLLTAALRSMFQKQKQIVLSLDTEC